MSKLTMKKSPSSVWREKSKLKSKLGVKDVRVKKTCKICSNGSVGFGLSWFRLELRKTWTRVRTRTLTMEGRGGFVRIRVLDSGNGVGT